MNAQILVIEDEPAAAEMLGELLLAHGYTSALTYDPAEALEMLRTQSFDLVISDFKMPGLDGAELLQAIRKDRPELPVVMVSGMMNPRDLIRVANLSVNLVLEKPFNVHDLVDYIRRYVKPGRVSSMDSRAGSLVGASYPQPAQEVCARSWLAQTALQSLWEATPQREIVTVVTTDAQEGEMLARQIAEWRVGRADDVRQPDASGTVAEGEGVLLLSAMSGEEAYEVAAFLREAGARMQPRPCNTVVLLAPGLEERWEQMTRTPDLAPAITWPSLNQRPLDIADYCAETLRNLLGEAVRMEPTATGWVLNYGWPGGLRELRTVMRRAAAQVEKGRAITLLDLLQAARANGVSEAEVGDDASLGAYLQREQAALLQQGLSASAQRDPLAAAQESHIPADRIARELPLKDQPLWFPELLRTPWHGE
ncbi:MAG: response regulator [Verrucomicrobiota bacterium JB022]|nr:response regulator [Verrucomicrobiota bacterium JB022]